MRGGSIEEVSLLKQTHLYKHAYLTAPGLPHIGAGTITAGGWYIPPPLFKIIIIMYNNNVYHLKNEQLTF